jgi:hypothetical protein
MEDALKMRLLAVVVTIGAFVVGATQGELIALGCAIGAALTASLGMWFMPPTDMGTDYSKLRDHILLSVPLACLAVVSGAVALYADGAFAFAPWLALVLALLVPASVLEQRLMQDA